jgi:hypothetical protein
MSSAGGDATARHPRLTRDPKRTCEFFEVGDGRVSSTALEAIVARRS